MSSGQILKINSRWLSNIHANRLIGSDLEKGKTITWLGRGDLDAIVKELFNYQNIILLFTLFKKSVAAVRCCMVTLPKVCCKAAQIDWSWFASMFWLVLSLFLFASDYKWSVNKLRLNKHESWSNSCEMSSSLNRKVRKWPVRQNFISSRGFLAREEINLSRACTVGVTYQISLQDPLLWWTS